MKLPVGLLLALVGLYGIAKGSTLESGAGQLPAFAGAFVLVLGMIVVAKRETRRRSAPKLEESPENATKV
jgi:hypothetical protein